MGTTATPRFADTIRRGRHVGIVVCLLGITLPPGASRAAGDGPSAPDRAAIEALAAEILGRIDARQALGHRLLEEQHAAKKALEVAQKAGKAAEVAEISAQEYVEGSIPQALQTAEGEIKLAESELERAKDRHAWAEKVFKRGEVAEAEVLAERMSRQKAEISLLNARKKLEVLKKYTFDKNKTELEANVKRSMAEADARKADLEYATTASERTQRQLADSELTKAESAAIISLDDAIKLFDSGDAEKAREALARATKTWRDEQDRRARVRFDKMKSRVRSMADKARSAR